MILFSEKRRRLKKWICPTSLLRRLGRRHPTSPPGAPPTPVRSPAAAGSPIRDEDGRRQGSAHILWETRAAGRLPPSPPPSPRRCPPHLFVVPLGGLSRGARTVAQASMVSAARARLPVVGVRWLPARLPMVGAWRASAAAWLPVGCPAARHLALSAWPPVVTPLRQLHLRLWCWNG